MQIRVYDLATGEVVRRFLPCRWQGAIPSLSVSSDGKKLLYCGDRAVVRVYDLETGGRYFAGSGHDGMLVDCSASPDGKLLASCGADGQVMLWDAETSEFLWSYDCGPQAEPYSLTWSPDGKLLYVCADESPIDYATGDHDGAVHAINIPTKSRAFKTQVGVSPRACVTTADGNQLAVLSFFANLSLRMNFAVVSLFDARDGQFIRHCDEIQAGAQRNMHLRYSADESQLIIHYVKDNYAIARIDVATGATVGQPTEVANVPGQLDEHGDLLVVRRRGAVNIIDTATLKSVGQIQLDDAYIGSIALSADGRWLATSSKLAETVDGTQMTQYGKPATIHLWDVVTGEMIHTISDVTFPISSLRFSRDKKTLYGGARVGALGGWDISAAGAAR